MARYYDLDLLDDPADLAMYLSLAASGDGPILELAAGSGRICVPLAAAGHDVTAVDIDAAMLDRARARREGSGPAGRGGTLTLVEHDLTTLRLPTRFALVILALNSLLLLDGRAAQERALRVMRAHLAPGGRAVIDVWLPTRDDLALYDGRQVLDWVRTDKLAGTRVAKTSSATYDAMANCATITSIFDEVRGDEPARRTTREDRVSFLSTDELVALALEAGLEPVTLAGGYDMTPLAARSERVVLVARPAPG